MEIPDNSATIAVLFGDASNRSSRLNNLALRELDKGLGQFTSKSYELAIESFNKAIRLSPGSETAVNANDYKARAQLSQGNTQAAIESYRSALRINAERDDLHVQLGNIYTTEERYAEAAEQYELAVKSNPSAANRYSLGQGYMAIGRLDEAKAQFELVRQASPKDPFGNFGLGQVYARQERYDFSVEAFDAAIAIKPDHWESYVEKGYALVDSGAIDQATDIATSLETDNEALAAQLSQYIYEKSNPRMVAAYSDPVFAVFPAALGPGTLVAGLNAYLLNASTERTFAMVFQFSKQMDVNSVQNTSNWTISRASGSGRGDGYNLDMALPDTEAAISAAPLSVYYNDQDMTATVLFKISQNAAANATIDPSHINFSFNGKDALGLTMDKTADMYSGFSSFA